MYIETNVGHACMYASRIDHRGGLDTCLVNAHTHENLHTDMVTDVDPHLIRV